MKNTADVIVVGTGVAGLFTALHLPHDKDILLITKSDIDKSDSFLAQGGICVMYDESDYESYFEDTMRAGHYENRKESVDIMLRSSRAIIDELIELGVDFAKNPDGEYYYFSTKAPRAYTEVEYPDNCFLFFGKETAGLPEELLLKHPETSVRVPMISGARSLNLSNTVAIVAYEALRQIGFPNMK